jgi:regulation of enolase protein 1 (concanavalin A-like superfamily)
MKVYENSIPLCLGKYVFLVVCFLFISCGQNKSPTSNEIETPEAFDSNNLLSKMTSENLNGFKWINEPKNFFLGEHALHITAPKGSDYFNNPEDLSVTATAPFLYREIDGDFVAVAHVQPDFSSQWNAMSLMMHIDSSNWIKFAFENSDATGPGIVSVVTRTVSDDANGAILDSHHSIWLKLVRKNNLFSMLWSSDGKDYKMARLAAMKDATTIKIGIEAQSPVGIPSQHECLYFSIEQKTVKDLRKGQ